ncbi:MAG: acetylxylan esterase [Planctomycetaceae bacterium]|nr:acetylxylan esterase [Planctomycetaceae bacterium]
MKPAPLSRRQLLASAGSLVAPALASPLLAPLAEAFAAEPKTGSSAKPAASPKTSPPAASAAPVGPPLNRFPRAVHDFYLQQVRYACRRSEERYGKAKSPEAYIEEVRNLIAQCFGPWPEKTPLNPKITGSVTRDAYRIENVIFESRPEFYVTANLYLPKTVKGKIPGVVGSCGHSANGKALEAYQSFAQGLARQGYACLIFDPIGQGERLQFPDENLKPKIGSGTSEHMMVGNQQFLVGQFFGSWRAWDGIRALDYLLSREEVDPNHIGITGNSGGGTMTTWLMGVERRWTMAAPSCFVTSFLNNMENELPADTEQCPPGVLARGLDHVDFLAAQAPKPLVILTQEQDFFDVRGSEQAYARLKRLYAQFGAEDKLTLFTGPGGHGYAQDAREAMYSCFNKATGLGESHAKEPQLTLEDEKTLQCTKRGQIVDLKGRTVYSYTKETAEQLAQRRAQRPAEATTRALTAMAEQLTRRPDNAPTSYRILRPRKGKGHPLPSYTTYLLEAFDVPTPVYRLYDAPSVSRPPKSDGAAILYVAHDSSDVELADDFVTEIVKAQPDAAIYAVDVRGLGETRPNTCGENSYNGAYGCDYFYSVHAIMLGQSVPATRVRDVARALDFIESFGHQEIHLVARGYGTIPAAFAALPRKSVKQVTLKHALKSYTDLASTGIYHWPVSAIWPNALQQFDLPDVYEALKPKKLQMIETLTAADRVPV